MGVIRNLFFFLEFFRLLGFLVGRVVGMFCGYFFFFRLRLGVWGIE